MIHLRALPLLSLVALLVSGGIAGCGSVDDNPTEPTQEEDDSVDDDDDDDPPGTMTTEYAPGFSEEARATDCSACEAGEQCVGRWSLSPYTTAPAGGGAGGESTSEELVLAVALYCLQRPDVCPDSGACDCATANPCAPSDTCQAELPDAVGFVGVVGSEPEIDLSPLAGAVFCQGEDG